MSAASRTSSARVTDPGGAAAAAGRSRRPPSTTLEDRLRAAGTDVRRCTSDLRLGGAGWSLDVLPSAPVGGVDQNQRENDDALVAVVGLAGQRVLLPGDAEGQVLENLDLPACVVVGVPHHGSDGGFDAAFLGELAPRLGVVPVGPEPARAPGSGRTGGADGRRRARARARTSAATSPCRRGAAV